MTRFCAATVAQVGARQRRILCGYRCALRCVALVVGALVLPSKLIADGFAFGAEPEFPYVAYVAAPQAGVRSGPDEKHYETLTLPSGFAVEVYRHDQDGWCAIRPPDGSFSLVEASNVRLVEPGVVEVVVQDAPSRVGSSLAGKRSAVQVLLSPGELLETIGPTGPNDRWLKVSPPSGEFRWISANQLSRTPPVESSAEVPSRSSLWSAQTPRRRGAASIESATRTTNFGLEFRRVSPPTQSVAEIQYIAADEVANEGIEQAAAEATDAFSHLTPSGAGSANWGADRNASPDGGAIEVVEGSPAATKLAQQQRPVWPVDRASPPPAATPPVPISTSTSQLEGAPAPVETSHTSTETPGPPRMRFPGYAYGDNMDDRMVDLQLQLSQLIVEPPATWKLSTLRDSAQSLLPNVDQPLRKQQLTEMLTRIDAFERAQARYVRPWALGAPATGPAKSVNALASQPGGDATALAMSGGQPAAIRQRAQSDLTSPDSVAQLTSDDITPTPEDPFVGAMVGDTEARYDAVGTLKPVVSKRQQAPRYALVDDDGQVVAFLTPRADMNLQRFVGQRIGVHGSRGFMPEYRRAHVAAMRVTPLDGGIVR